MTQPAREPVEPFFARPQPADEVERLLAAWILDATRSRRAPWSRFRQRQGWN